MWGSVKAFLAVRRPATRKVYLRSYRQWSDHLRPDGVPLSTRWLSAGPKEVMAFMRSLQKCKGIKPRHPGSSETYAGASIRVKLVALREVYKVFVAEGLIAANPFLHPSIRYPSKRHNMKRDTELVDYNKIVSVIEGPSGEVPDGIRDRAILATLFGAGLRRSEARLLRIGAVAVFRNDIDGTETLVLRLANTKTGKDDQTPLPEWAAQYVSKLVAKRNGEGAQSADFLFVRYRGAKRTPIPGAIPDHSFYRYFLRACAKKGIPRTITPHSARATAITRLLDQGVNHRRVQWFSRHRHVEAVETYDKKRVLISENPALKLHYGD